jgi:hypothetical protein
VAAPQDHDQPVVADRRGRELGLFRQIGADLQVDAAVPEVGGVGGGLGQEAQADPRGLAGDRGQQGRAAVSTRS